MTGKWLFPRGDLDRWLLAGMTRPSGVVPADPPAIVGGSDDPLLQWAPSESRAGLAILPEGSESGHRRFLAGEVIAAAIHFHDLVAPNNDANIDVVSTESSLYDAVLFGFATREQGLLVAVGDSLGLTGVADALMKRVRLAARPEGAGAQQLLHALVQRAGMAAAQPRPVLVAATGADIAQAFWSDCVDWGIAPRAVVTAAGVGFVSLLTERFDMLMCQRDSYRALLQSFPSLLKSPVSAERTRELNGLDVSQAGTVRWAP